MSWLLCEGQGCNELATWQVHGHWTEVDWVDYYVCGQHLLAAHRRIAHTFIDGNPCRERWSQYVGRDKPS